MNSSTFDRQRMASILPSLLWLAEVISVAGILAGVAGSMHQWPWLARLALQSLAMAFAAVSLRLLTNRYRVDRTAAADAQGKHSRHLAEFLVVADHEMKTPLAGIKAYVELLTDGDADDETTRDEFLQGIGSQIDRLEQAIDELLQRARRESSLAGSETSSIITSRP